MILLNYQWAPVQCLLGQIHIKGREREGFYTDMDCCIQHSFNRGNPPFALVSFQLCPPVAVTRQPYQKHLAWRGRGGRNPSAYYVAFLVFVCFSFLLSRFLGWKLCLTIFCSIWVGSKCLSKSCVQAPSCAAQFDLLVLKSQRDLCTFRLQFHSNAIQGIWSKQKWILCTYM